jgi:Arc/MetJ family transcription regulator
VTAPIIVTIMVIKLVKGEVMRATVSLDDELVQRAQKYSGVSERTALLREALKALIEREASRSLAALEGTMPDLEYVRRLRVDDL